MSLFVILALSIHGDFALCVGDTPSHIFPAASGGYAPRTPLSKSLIQIMNLYTSQSWHLILLLWNSMYRPYIGEGHGFKCSTWLQQYMGTWLHTWAALIQHIWITIAECRSKQHCIIHNVFLNHQSPSKWMHVTNWTLLRGEMKWKARNWTQGSWLEPPVLCSAQLSY